MSDPGPWLALAGLGVFAFVAGTYCEWFEFMRNRGGRR